MSVRLVENSVGAFMPSKIILIWVAVWHHLVVAVLTFFCIDMGHCGSCATY